MAKAKTKPATATKKKTAPKTEAKAKRPEFTDVLVVEAQYSGVPIVSVKVSKPANGVYDITATFKDKKEALVRRRSDVFAGDDFLGRKELIAALVNAKK